MSLETNRVKFGEFLFDAKEKVLLRQGKPVSITPKTFELLLVLLENHGHLVEKNELMKAVWADSFVEEGNLTYTMRLLRIALGDGKRKPRFIETVSRRGYRFIAEVEEISAEFESKTGTAKTSFQKNGFAANASQKSKNIFIPIGAFAILLIGAIAIGSWYERNGNLESAAPVLSAPFASEKLSTNGKVIHAAVSLDGKNVVYTNGIEGKQSVWLRQLESSNNVEIIPPSNDFYDGLALSPDGNFLYFARRPRPTGEARSIYRVSIFGGVPAKIISDTEGWMSISPDGGKISFVRCLYGDDEYCSLWIADAADGKNERKLISRPRPIRIGDNKISDDGKTIAFAVGQSQNAANEFGLSEVNIESGVERELTAEKFFNIRNLAWLPDKSGWLITASRIPNKHFRIWQVSAATGEASPLTKDSETYSTLSLDKNASVLVSTQVKQDFRLFVLNRENPSNPRILADASKVTFAPNGKIVFSSLMSGNDEIWSIQPDGSEQRQLTNNAADDSMSAVSPAGNVIFFASNRTGETQVWRMNADGSNQTQITDKVGGYPLFVSLEGRWLYYQHALDKTLWRVSTAGGEEQLVLNKRTWFAFSPDGLQVAFLENRGEDKIIEVISLSDRQIVKTFKIAAQKPAINEIAWMPDGKGIVYISAEADENYALRLQPSDGGTPQKIADLGNERINSFAVAPDGKSFAVVQGGWRHDAVLLKGLK